jgi:3-hydroxyisobutyrate dehydrogenase-like beta-hydroxyacid dehydrogenase
MGTALAESLLDRGYTVLCHDRRPEAMAALTGKGAVAASAPRSLAADSEVVMTFLPGPEAVVDVALDRDHGVLGGLRAGTAMLDLSTCGPDVAEVVGTAFDAAGRLFLDCPVSRKAPEMTILVGGEPGVLGDAEEILEQVSRTIVHCGRRGAGYATKLLNQHVKYAWYLASAEALLVAKGLGLDPGAVASAIEQCSGGDSGLTTAAKYFRGDVDGMRAHAPASTIEKDAVLAEVMAGAAGVRTRTLDPVVDFFLDVSTTSFRQRPYPESCELLEELRIMPRKVGDK